MPQHTIQLAATSRVRLDPPDSHDDEAVANLRSHPLTLRYLRFLPTTFTAEEARVRRERRAENRDIVDFHIHVKNDDGSYSFGGVAGISYIDEANGSAEAGIIVSPHIYHKGVGTEALYNVLKYAFEDRKLHRVTFETGEDNVPMCSWLENVLEAKLDGKLRECWKDPEGRHTHVNLYSILEWEWTGGIGKKLEGLVSR
ncbi:putative acetyltransferase (GNAT) domain containing protein [Lyophyllum shimeji]|uniref:Acetyltransferase (GNAT) domain containing protein n=1 Tax=Lyophyllum shimeji TaxID=47721 RepID=A0A9P3PKF1_LYOSH|nr:putative acetyltransferase (GNAT) domain containing protein [Lyophyllum shimeji]